MQKAVTCKWTKSYQKTNSRQKHQQYLEMLRSSKLRSDYEEEKGGVFWDLFSKSGAGAQGWRRNTIFQSMSEPSVGG